MAVRVLLESGCAAAAVEVSCPIARHRVDAAGYVDPLPKSSSRQKSVQERMPTGFGGIASAALVTRAARARTVIVECKQSRADFLADGKHAPRLLERREHLNAVRAALEERIVKVCEPELRKSGTSLFADMEEWDFGNSRVESYRQVLRELASVDRQLHGSAKFWRLAHYRLADALYVAAPTGLIQPHELPRGWGLLEVSRHRITDEAWSVRVPAPALEGRAMHRRRLLRNIAVALSRRAVRRSSREA